MIHSSVLHSTRPLQRKLPICSKFQSLPLVAPPSPIQFQLMRWDRVYQPLAASYRYTYTLSNKSDPVKSCWLTVDLPWWWWCVERRVCVGRILQYSTRNPISRKSPYVTRSEEKRAKEQVETEPLKSRQQRRTRPSENCRNNRNRKTVSKQDRSREPADFRLGLWFSMSTVHERLWYRSFSELRGKRVPALDLLAFQQQISWNNCTTNWRRRGAWSGRMTLYSHSWWKESSAVPMAWRQEQLRSPTTHQKLFLRTNLSHGSELVLSHTWWANCRELQSRHRIAAM